MKNEKNVWKSITVIAVVLSILAIAMVGTASAKSLYLAADHYQDPVLGTPINAYTIPPGIPSPPANDLTYLAQYRVAYHGIGGTGMAIWEDPNGDGDFSDAQVFMTYEFSDLVEAFYAVDFTPVPGTPITAPVASDLAGIVVDQEKSRVYAVDRFGKNLYVYDAATFLPPPGVTLPIPLPTLDNGAVGLALDEDRDWLFITDFDSTVHYFDTATWNQVGTITTASVSAIGIAIDEDNQFVYTAGGWAMDSRLAKYDMTTGTATFIDLSDIEPGLLVHGLAVDLNTNLLWATTDWGIDDLRVFDSSMNQVYVYPDTEGKIINPAGIVIPREEIIYNPLHLSKDDGLAEDECVNPGEDITYDICYDNTANLYPVHNVAITDTLPAEVSFVSATGSYTIVGNTVTWDIGDLPAGEPTACVELVVNVNPGTAPETTIQNCANIDSDETPATEPVCEDTVTCKNRPPDVSDAYPSIDCLWPPNHKFVDITIENVTDPDDDPVTITITGITSDEPTASIKGAGGAKHAPDASGVGTDTASLRAERSGTGNGRVYEITFVASDGIAETVGSVTVCVPHDKSDVCECVDDGQDYDATGIN